MASPPSFFWHDYETFGLSPRRDRPAQFAGVRTDLDLNEIGEPVMLYCQPVADYFPSVTACLLTGITPQLCQTRGVPEYQFAAQIEAELGASGTFGVGYNTFKFDDEVTRFTFWRNLIEPYGREWQNGCGRWDLLGLVRAMYALRPEGMVWPQDEDGRVSLKLERLTAANGLAHEAAHDALSDVRATLALARLIKQLQPRLFDFCFKLARKEAVKAELGAQLDRPFLHVSGMYGVDHGCLALVWPLAWHPRNANELIVWDLREDTAVLADLSPDDIQMRMFTPKAALPEGVTRLPIKTLHINQAPIVIHQLSTLSPAQAAKWQIDFEQSLAYAAQLRDHPVPRTVWEAVYAPRTEDAIAPDVDEALYNGFVSAADRRILQRFREDLARGTSVQQPGFEDARLPSLSFRYRARNFPASLTAEEQVQWQAHCTARRAAMWADQQADFVAAQPLAATSPAQQSILDALRMFAGSVDEG